MLNHRPGRHMLFSRTVGSPGNASKMFKLTVSFHKPLFRCVVVSVQRSSEDFPSGSLLSVSDGTSLTFNGDVTIREVENVGSVVENDGDLE